MNANQQLWDTANRLPTIDIFNKPGLFPSDANGTLSMRNECSVGTMDVRRLFAEPLTSKISLNRQVSTVGTNTITAQTMRAKRQPIRAITTGMHSPAIIPPRGTPACLTENMRLRISGGENLCSTSLPAGFAAPLLIPMAKQATRATAMLG